ncbi:MAG: holo-ACP synthase [Synergistaceae bacterium]|nr:holo-ACP synthase [Synergistaceae bacterium]
MIAGIGVDICEISRIKRALKSEHFRTKIYTPDEIAYCEAKGAKKFESYSAGFAAREAFCKASGIPLMFVMDANNFSLIRENGKPSIKLSRKLEGFNDSLNGKIFLSVSHDGDYVCAMVVIESEEKHYGN